MSKNIHRGFIATLAAGALTLSLAPMASATVNNPDSGAGRVDVVVPEETAFAAEVFRIADSNRILTAIKASKSRTDWGTGLVFNSDVRWACEAPTADHVLFNGAQVKAPYGLGDKVTTLNGAIAGTVVGTVEGTVEGSVDGFIDGDLEGTVDGILEGDIDGTVSGALTGALVNGAFQTRFGNLRIVGFNADAFSTNFFNRTYRIVNGNGRIVGSINGRVFADLRGEIDTILDASIVDGKIVDGSFDGLIDAILDGDFEGMFEGDFEGDLNGAFDGVGVVCEAVETGDFAAGGKMDIIVARADDYPDALAAGPLADVLTAPILLNPSDALNGAVKAEIARLASLGGARDTTVHVLGGTDALSDAVFTGIAGTAGVNDVIRYQGIDRYETAVAIATEVVNIGIFSGAGVTEVNAYLTTGTNFPDALAAGAAAANNDGVVVLTNGTELDRRGFTDDFLINLDNLVDLGTVNTSEIFAVGGPSAAAAAAFDIRLAPNGAYVGADRYETATLTAAATFGAVPSGDFAVVSGEAFPDALVAGGFIANLDGPLLLTRADALTPVTATYLNTYVMNGDRIFTFGGPDSLKAAVTQEIRVLLEAKFAIDPEIR